MVVKLERKNAKVSNLGKIFMNDMNAHYTAGPLVEKFDRRRTARLAATYSTLSKTKPGIE